MNDNEAKASSGQPFKPPPARIWNDMVDAGRAYREGLFSNGAPDRTRPRSTDIIKVRNDSGASRVRGEIVGFNGSALSECTPENIWLIGEGAQPNEGFGVLRYNCSTGEFVECQVSGVCIARVDVSDAGHKYAKVPAAGGHVLESAESGPVALLFNPGTGEADCVVVLNAPMETSLVRFELQADLLSGTALATIKTMGGATIEDANVLDPEGIFDELVSGDTGLAVKQNGIYYATQAPCGVISASGGV